MTTIPASYWKISLGRAYRGASQEELDALMAQCREAEVVEETDEPGEEPNE